MRVEMHPSMHMRRRAHMADDNLFPPSFEGLLQLVEGAGWKYAHARSQNGMVTLRFKDAGGEDVFALLIPPRFAKSEAEVRITQRTIPDSEGERRVPRWD